MSEESRDDWVHVTAVESGWIYGTHRGVKKRMAADADRALTAMLVRTLPGAPGGVVQIRIEDGEFEDVPEDT